MIYHRRALQRRLKELRGVLKDEEVDKFAKDLNRPGRDRLARMWELVVLHGLSKCGAVHYEVPLASSRQPDICFQKNDLKIIADVTTISDEGLDDGNPYQELMRLVESAKSRLKLPIGGLDLLIRAREESSARGTRTVLMLPKRSGLQAFVNDVIVPRLRQQISEGSFPLRLAIEDEGVGLDLVVDPSKSPINSASFSNYDIPTIKDRNALYSALKQKAKQLRGADGIRGVIVCDGDCVALGERSSMSRGVSPEEIVKEFFRQFSSVDFVLLLSVRQQWDMRLSPLDKRLLNTQALFVRDGNEAKGELSALFDEMMLHFPQPAMLPVNGGLRAREDRYPGGHHGGYQMPNGNTIRMSLREFTEILAGLRELEDGGATNVEAARRRSAEPSRVRAAVLAHLADGRLPESINILPGGEDSSDDWVEVTFGGADPAVAPLQ
ncbi:MAG: hypothetical protein ABWY09_09350 [Stenotrophomonas maltophilia]